jgi:rhodanese-related sulfurtransferase
MDFFGKMAGQPVTTVNVMELHEKICNGEQLLLLDVREPEEFRMGHIEAAKLIPLGELENRTGELPRDSQIVCICASGSRSEAAVQILKAAGIPASSLRSGMIGWQMANLPIKKGM